MRQWLWTTIAVPTASTAYAFAATSAVLGVWTTLAVPATAAALLWGCVGIGGLVGSQASDIGGSDAGFGPDSWCVGSCDSDDAGTTNDAGAGAGGDSGGGRDSGFADAGSCVPDGGGAFQCNAGYCPNNKTRFCLSSTSACNAIPGQCCGANHTCACVLANIANPCAGGMTPRCSGTTNLLVTCN